MGFSISTEPRAGPPFKQRPQHQTGSCHPSSQTSVGAPHWCFPQNSNKIKSTLLWLVGWDETPSLPCQTPPVINSQRGSKTKATTRCTAALRLDTVWPKGQWPLPSPRGQLSLSNTVFCLLDIFFFLFVWFFKTTTALHRERKRETSPRKEHSPRVSSPLLGPSQTRCPDRVRRRYQVALQAPRQRNPARASRAPWH